MIKLVTLLAIIAVVGTLLLVKKDESALISGTVETTSNIPTQSTPAPQTLGLSTNSVSSDSWKIYSDEKLGFRLKYPEGVQIKSVSEGSVLLSKDSLSISISQNKLSSKDTVNTVAEQDVNSKMDKLGDKYRLIETISPIAIGSQTGVTYSSEELGKEITYFYIPQGFKYLVIANETTETKTGNLISLSDEIIYSLEFIEK